MTQDDAALRLTALVASMTERLRPLCMGWPEEEFSSMVQQLAEITVKYEGYSTVGTYDRRATDRLVAELKEALDRNEQLKQRTSGAQSIIPGEAGSAGVGGENS